MQAVELQTGIFKGKELKVEVNGELLGISYDSKLRPDEIFNGRSIVGVIRNGSFLIEGFAKNKN